MAVAIQVAGPRRCYEMGVLYIHKAGLQLDLLLPPALKMLVVFQPAPSRLLWC